MMASPAELSFDYKPQMYSMHSKSFGDDKTEETREIEEFLARLEEERLKIEAFKRELPLCMQLLTNAMEASRQELKSQRKKQGGGPVLEEFIPLKNTTSSQVTVENNGANTISDKANWMISAQLWNQGTGPKETDDDMKLDLNANHRINGGGAFLPFSSKDGNSAFPELALASSHKEETQDDNNSSETVPKRENSCGGAEKESGNTTQTQRKARRCWSPDLHRRFVNALHMLGGSQAATPKQIRELMKVDGLTNDEVKSHLQKYRLHTRSLSPSTQAAVTPGPQVVVLGGIWVPPEYAAAAAHAGYGAHARPVMPQENYHAIAPPPPPPKNQLNHGSILPQQFHLYNNPPLMTKRNSSLESDIHGGAGNPSESIEDNKSESSSWKADSGGENIGAKRLQLQESNTSFVSFNL